MMIVPSGCLYLQLPRL